MFPLRGTSFFDCGMPERAGFEVPEHIANYEAFLHFIVNLISKFGLLSEQNIISGDIQVLADCIASEISREKL